MSLRTLILAGLFLTPAIAHAEQRQFDYDCASTSSGGGRTVTTTIHYRVDLDASRWCMGLCAGQQTIKGVTAEKLTLADERSDAARRFITIDRRDGAYAQEMSVKTPTGNLSQTTSGFCKLAEFSGFPAPGAGRQGMPARPPGPPPRPPGPPPRPAGL